MSATKTPDRHGNVIAEEGCTRCACGCKYWENDRCVDCGSPAPTPEPAKTTRPRLDSIKPGSVVEIDLRSGTRSIDRTETVIFAGVKGEGDDRRAVFVQGVTTPFLKDGKNYFEWEAYRYLGGWAYGSSADSLGVVRVIAEPAR
jgi:hypothetical protein